MKLDGIRQHNVKHEVEGKVVDRGMMASVEKVEKKKEKRKKQSKEKEKDWNLESSR